MKTLNCTFGMNVGRKELEEFKFIGNFFYPGILLYRLNQSVFIVDQHAADERCRFEHLQKHNHQNFTIPQLQNLACKGTSLTVYLFNRSSKVDPED